MAAFSNKEFCGLDVPVDDPFRVSSIQCVRNLNCHIQQFLHLHGAASDGVLQCLAFQILHGNECFAIVIADVIHGADVRMI